MQTPPRCPTPHSYDHKCVCQICTCGQHTCPEPNVPFTADTSYHADFKTYHIEKDFPIKNVGYTPNRGKFDGVTSYQLDYSPKEIRKVQGFEPQSYMPNRIPFQGQTTYDSEYRPHKIQLEPKTNMYPGGLESRGPLLGESRYKEDYKGYTCQRREGCAVERLPARPGRCSPGKQHLQYSAEKKHWE